MPRRSLSILPCPVYAPGDPTPRGEAGCEHCGHRVYDLAAMEEHDALRLLGEPRERLCVHARVRRDGSLVFRRASLTMGLSLGLGTLAACAPHHRELELPGSLCEDADGYEISCESEVDAWLQSIPELPPSSETAEPREHAEHVDEPGGPTPTPESRHADENEYDMLGFVDASDMIEEAELEAEQQQLLELEARAIALRERGT